MPLAARKVAHIAANREKFRFARTETVVLVASGTGDDGIRRWSELREPVDREATEGAVKGG